MSAKDSSIHPIADKFFDGLLTVHRPAVSANIAFLTKRNPTSSPTDLIRRIERQYLTVTTAGGAGIGAAAILPGVGTGASLLLSGAGTLAFLETSAIFAQSVAHVHGTTIDEPERARLLIMSLLMGGAGLDMVKQLAAQAIGGGPSQQVFWGQVIANQLPNNMVGQVSNQIRKAAVKKVSKDQAGNAVGRLLPFGVGAAIGGAGNHLLARRVVRSARTAFGQPPLILPAGVVSVPATARQGEPVVFERQ